MSVVLPVVLIPIVFLTSAWLEGREAERAEARTYRVAIAGPDSVLAAALLADILVGAGPGPAALVDEGRRFLPVALAEPRRALDEGHLDVLLEAFTPEAWRALDDEARADVELDAEYADARVFRIAFNSSRTASRQGAARLRDHLEERRSERRDSILVQAGFPVPTARLAGVDTVNVATVQDVAGARLGRYLTLILVGLMLLGGSAVATDALAGEKERGTLLTLLTAAAARGEIVAGKLLALMAVALGIALVQILNLWVFLGLGILDVGEGFAVAVSPGLAIGLIVLYLPVVALVGGVLMLTSAYARSYKEAQLYMTPVLLGMAVPALAPVLPDITLRSAILAVPIANLAVGARDLLLGQVDLPGIAIAWIVTAGAAFWVTTRSVRALHDELLITGDTSREEFLGGPDLFRRRVLRWFLAFWAVAMLLQFNLRIEDMRIAVLVNVGLVFLAFTFLVVRYFRLDPREALALRSPRPGVWLGVAIGAPAAALVATGVFRLADLVLPVPAEVLESFGQGLLPEHIPAWQLILVLSIVPGITEELAFRGVLLHGLRRRFGPVGLALVVGLIFGFFHFQLFRIPATAFLGVVLTAVTLLSGSIFPAIAWHTLNNALAVFLASRDVDVMAVGWDWIAGGVAFLIFAFLILWRYRTPYPDVGRPRRGRGGPGGPGP
jgi:sodium transport system permease protein